MNTFSYFFICFILTISKNMRMWSRPPLANHDCKIFFFTAANSVKRICKMCVSSWLLGTPQYFIGITHWAPSTLRHHIPVASCQLIYGGSKHTLHRETTSGRRLWKLWVTWKIRQASCWCLGIARSKKKQLFSVPELVVYIWVVCKYKYVYIYLYLMCIYTENILASL